MGIPPPPKQKKKKKKGDLKNCQKWKNQSCSKLPEMARKLVEHVFFYFLAPPKKIFWGRTQNFCQKWKKSKLFKIAWNGEKNSQKRVLDFLAPPKKCASRTKNFVKNEKNQNCSKLPEMARKLVENDIGVF